MCKAWLPSKETRHPVLSLAGFTSAALYRRERKRRYELDFDRGLGTQNNMRHYFCTLQLNTKIQLAVWKVNVGPPAAEPRELVVRARWSRDLKLSWLWLHDGWWRWDVFSPHCFHGFMLWMGAEAHYDCCCHFYYEHAHIIERGADPLYNFACLWIYVLTRTICVLMWISWTFAERLNWNSGMVLH